MDKPVPVPNADTKAYWDACAKDILLYQYCKACGHAQFYPRATCLRCGERALDWRPSNGRGVVTALTQVHVGLPAYKPETPYDIVLVQMDESFTMLMNVVGGREELAIGSRGHVIFEARGDVKLPQFRLDPA